MNTLSAMTTISAMPTYYLMDNNNDGYVEREEIISSTTKKTVSKKQFNSLQKN